MTERTDAPIQNAWRILLVALLSLITAGQVGCASASKRERDTLRVLSWNIHHGEGTDGEFDLVRIAERIRALDVDLVALQEVDRTTGRSRWRDQALEIASLSGMHHIYGPAMRYDRGEYGEAILSRWPISHARTIQMPKIEGSEPRALLVAEIETPIAGRVRFASTHLAHDSGHDRLEQARIILNELNDGSLPTIVAGDLNAEPDDPPMRLLLGFFEDTHAANPRPTFSAADPTRRIDYILTAPGNGWRIVETTVIAGDIASDHCLVLTELTRNP